MGVSQHRSHRSEEDRAEPTERYEVTRGLLRSPALWGLAAVYGFRAMALVALVTILPLYLDNDLGLSPSSRGIHIGLLIAIGLLAKPVTGYLSDRLGRKPVLGPGLVWSCVLALGLLAFDSGVLLTVCVALLGLFLYPDQPILTAAVFDAVESEVASTGLGFVSFVGSLMAVVSPLIAGGLYEGVGFEAVVVLRGRSVWAGGGDVRGGAGGGEPRVIEHRCLVYETYCPGLAS